MSEDKSNIIQLPNSRVNKSQPQEQCQCSVGNKEAINPAVVLQRIADNRRKGLANLENKVDGFSKERKVSYEAHVEDRFRDSENAITAAYTNLEALNAMVDMIAHDLIGAIQNLEQNAVGQFQASAHLQVLLQVLKERGIVTEEELKETWEKTIASQAPTDPADQK